MASLATSVAFPVAFIFLCFFCCVMLTVNDVKIVNDWHEHALLQHRYSFMSLQISVVVNSLHLYLTLQSIVEAIQFSLPSPSLVISVAFSIAVISRYCAKIKVNDLKIDDWLCAWTLSSIVFILISHDKCLSSRMQPTVANYCQ